MGIIKDARTAMATAERRGEDYLEAAAAVLGNISVALSKPSFVGDIETALVHHMGAGVVTAEGATAPYMELGSKIAEQSDEVVPILAVDCDGGPSQIKTTFLRVERDNPKFTSTKIHEYDDGQSDAPPEERTGYTYHSLFIDAETTVFEGDLLRPGSSISQQPHDEELFMLSESKVPGSDNDEFAAHGFAANQETRFDNGIRIFVGWQEIEKALLGSIQAATSSEESAGRRLVQLWKAQRFLEAVVPDAEFLKQRAPHLALIIETGTNINRLLEAAIDKTD